MAGEIQFVAPPGSTAYSVIRDQNGLVWSTSGYFGVYATANYSFYGISASEQGTQSAFFVGNFPTAITAGVYNVVAHRQIGGSIAEADPTVAQGQIEWNGASVIPLSSLMTSGQPGIVLLTRSRMVQNFPIYFKSAADHITPLVSGSVSGQISRDGGNFGPLQSGAFSEVGQGFYSLQALTSGDLNANTVAMLFTAVGVSGGAADPVPLAYVLQRSSGY